MSNHNANIIGVDVSGEHLDGHRLRDGESRRFANDGRGIRALVRWAGPEVVGVVYEATSSYHRDLEAALFKAELLALRVNPRRAREFARASGMLAKTDKVDAMMLACMGAALEIEVARELSPARRELRELTSLRDALVGERPVVHIATLDRGKRHDNQQVSCEKERTGEMSALACGYAFAAQC